MPFDSSAALFYASLSMSAAAVVLFLWLIREPRKGGALKDGEKGSGGPKA